MSDSSHTDYFCLPIGYKVGGYTIRNIIGYGGFGITYAVYDEGLDNDYVLKENMPRFFCSRDSTTKQVTAPAVGEMADGYAWATERFKDEARTLAKLKHPGIVRVLRTFDALGTSYYVMDKIDGQELGRATENRRDEAFLRHILHRLLHTLQYLHQKNILHRDIKPSNILLTQEDEPILIDFGTARSLITQRTHTRLQSPGYTPFEQTISKGNPGPWTDLYALGATFCKLITGETPPDSAERIQDDSFRPLAEREELKGVYSDIFLRCIDKALAPHVKDRCQSAEEWLAQLDGSKAANETARQAQEELDRRLAEVKAAEDAAAALAEQARRTQEEYDRRIAALHEAEKAAAGQEKEKEQPAAQETEVADLGAPKHFSFTKNGKPFPFPYRNNCCTFSADGNWCLFESNMEAHLFEVKTRKVLQTFSYMKKKWLGLSSEKSMLRGASMSPDGLYVALIDYDSGVRIFHRSGACLKTPTEEPYQGGRQIIFSPTPGQFYIAAAFDIRRTDMHIGKTDNWRPLPFGEIIKHCALSPDGQKLAVTGGGYSYTIISASTGKAHFTLKAPAKLTRITFSADSRLLVATTANAVLLINADSGKTEKQYTLDGEPYSISVSPNGVYLAVGLEEDEKRPARIILMEMTSGDIVGERNEDSDYYPVVQFVPRTGKPMQLMANNQLLDLIED